MQWKEPLRDEQSGDGAASGMNSTRLSRSDMGLVRSVKKDCNEGKEMDGKANGSAASTLLA